MAGSDNPTVLLICWSDVSITDVVSVNVNVLSIPKYPGDSACRGGNKPCQHIPAVRVHANINNAFLRLVYSGLQALIFPVQRSNIPLEAKCLLVTPRLPVFQVAEPIFVALSIPPGLVARIVECVGQMLNILANFCIRYPTVWLVRPTSR